jgi:hypothetical protein
MCNTDERVTALAAHNTLKPGQQSLFLRIFERWADGKNIDSEFHFFTDEYDGKYEKCFVAMLDKHWLYGCYCQAKKPIFYRLCVLISYVKKSSSNNEKTILQDCIDLYFSICSTARSVLNKSTQRNI